MPPVPSPPKVDMHIRVKLKSYEVPAIEAAAKTIIEAAGRTGAVVSGQIRLPTQINRYTVISGPFKDKDAQEHFEIRTHKRLIEIRQPTTATVGALERVSNLPTHVDIEILLRD